MTEPVALLVLPHLQVQNANAISSPLTWGFPAPTAFTGFAHALSRRLSKVTRLDIALDGVAIISHGFEPQISGTFVKVFRLTRNPIDEKGNSPAFVEEGRVHLEISLVIGVSGDDLLDLDNRSQIALAKHIQLLAQSQRLAGGSIFPSSDTETHQPKVFILPSDIEERNKQMRNLRRCLLPGFALVSREDVLQQQLHDMQACDSSVTALDALLDLSALHWDCKKISGEHDQEGNEKIHWQIRSRPGWLVPIPVGYAAISPLYPPGEVKNARDKTVPFRFVESVYSLGQWISPHRVEDIRSLLWYHQADPEAGLYCCTNLHSESIKTE